ncbi:MAG: ABC transporter permease subunit [Fimbriimonadaceae bacterium]|nr:ABC transporter permease subunit [Fimbriimonadaceae bacterium]QYK56834.1 MAG: ABC transporter permease subunit [Fimbriimonadaceae bacterium]
MRVHAFLLCLLAGFAAGETVTVGSKRFVESYVLAEIAKGLAEREGLTVDHKQGMGGTAVLWQALEGGQIQAYPEYTGTISEEILKLKGKATPEQLSEGLKARGIGMTAELGFNNTYAFVMREDRAERLGVATISDLLRQPDMRVALTPEFLNRSDGWPAVSRAYGLPQKDVTSVDHALGYQALSSGRADVKDAYSTDAQIADLKLRLLVDDKNFFPAYRAVYLYRLDAPRALVAALEKAAGTLDEPKMTALNAEATRTTDYAAAAQKYLAEQPAGAAAPEAPAPQRDLLAETMQLVGQHLTMVAAAVVLGVAAGVPLGVLAARGHPLGQAALALAGIVQTVPSIALLLFLIPVFGLGAGAAIAALFLYSLLPIVRNTAAGLQSVPLSIRESAAAIGFEPGAQLRKVGLPLAARTIVAGIKTSAVISVGNATLAAFIGAGGLGQPIVSGLALNNIGVMMQGAVPAALLALAVQFAFEGVERLVVPEGLRREAAR